MGRMAQTWKPWPLGPSPLARVWSWSQLEEEPTLVSGSIELQPAPLMQPMCQAWKRVPAHYLETFLLEIAHLAAFFLSILSSHTTSPTYTANHPSFLPPEPLSFTSANGETSTWREDHARTDAPNSRTHTRHHLRRGHTLVSKRRFSAEHKRRWVRECHGFPASCGQRRKLGY